VLEGELMVIDFFSVNLNEEECTDQMNCHKRHISSTITSVA